MCWLIRTSEIFDEVIKQEFKNENPHEPPGVGGIDELEEKWVQLRRFNKKLL